MTIQQIATFFRDTPNLSFLEKIVDVADEVGERAVISCLNIKYSSWKIFLNLSALKKVLVFDATLGLESVALAQHAETVTTVVYDAATLSMLKVRFRDEGIDNIDVIEHSFNRLPFDDNTFDLIVCRDAQRILSVLMPEVTAVEISADLNRVLKEGGDLLLGFSERPVLGMFAPTVQTTEPCYHCSKVAVIKYFKRKQYKVRDIIYCLPEQYLFDELISQSTKPFWIRDTIFLKSKIKNLLIKYLYPVGSPNSSYFLAKNKSVEKQPFYRQVILKVSECVDSSLILRRILVGNPNTILLLLDGEQSNYVARLPLCQNSSRRMKNQSVVLSALRMKGSLQSFDFPKVYPSFNISSQDVYLEEMLSGTVLDENRLLSDLSEKVAIDWLISFHSATICRRRMGATDIENMVKSPFSVLMQYSKSNSEFRILERLTNQVENFFLMQGNSFFVCMHGDYKIENMLFTSDHSAVTGVFDWDLAQLSGFPCIDLLYFIAYSSKLRGEKASITEILFKKFICELMTAEDRSKIDRYMISLGMTASDLKFYGLIACIYHIVYRLSKKDRCWGKTYEENIGKLLKSLSEFF